jgi:hypothetical protein
VRLDDPAVDALGGSEIIGIHDQYALGQLVTSSYHSIIPAPTIA